MNRPCTRDEELEDFLLKHLYETENRIVLKEEESGGYREVQLNLTPKIEVLNMLFDRYLSIFSISIYNTSISGVKFSWTFLYLGFDAYLPCLPECRCQLR